MAEYGGICASCRWLYGYFNMFGLDQRESDIATTCLMLHVFRDHIVFAILAPLVSTPFRNNTADCGSILKTRCVRLVYVTPKTRVR